MNKTPEQHGELQAYEEASKRLGVPAEDLIAMSELSKFASTNDLGAALDKIDLDAVTDEDFEE